MDDLLPADPRARRLAVIILLAGGAVGTLVVWWLSSYVEYLTTLAQTDRDASLHLFRTRVLPVLGVVTLGAVLCGALMMRQGALIARSGEFPPPGSPLVRPARRQRGKAARAIGYAFIVLGLLMAAGPLAGLGIVIWLLRGA